MHAGAEAKSGQDVLWRRLRADSWKHRPPARDFGMSGECEVESVKELQERAEYVSAADDRNRALRGTERSDSLLKRRASRIP